MEKVRIGKGMISKLIPPFNGLIGLVMAIGCTIDGFARTLQLAPISINTKLGSLYLKSGKVV
jgi:hypothetical protein